MPRESVPAKFFNGSDSIRPAPKRQRSVCSPARPTMTCPPPPAWCSTCTSSRRAQLRRGAARRGGRTRGSTWRGSRSCRCPTRSPSRARPRWTGWPSAARCTSGRPRRSSRRPGWRLGARTAAAAISPSTAGRARTSCAASRGSSARTTSSPDATSTRAAPVSATCRGFVAALQLLPVRSGRAARAGDSAAA